MSPRGRLATSGDILVVTTVGKVLLLASSGVEAKDATKPPTMHRTVSCPQHKIIQPKMCIVLRRRNLVPQQCNTNSKIFEFTAVSC